MNKELTAQGQPDTAERKVAICERAYHLLVEDATEESTRASSSRGAA